MLLFRFTVSAVGANGRLFVFGGEALDISFCEYYEIAKEEWKAIE